MKWIAFEECTEAIITQIRLIELSQVAKKLGVKITDVIISNGRVKYSTPDGTKVVDESIDTVENESWLTN